MPNSEDEIIFDQAQATGKITQECHLFEYETKYSGETREDKLKKVHADLAARNCDFLYVNVLEEISWLLNIKATG